MPLSAGSFLALCRSKQTSFLYEHGYINFILGLQNMSTLTSISTSSPTATCISGLIPDKNGYVSPEACNANYTYYPSFAAAITFSVIFGLAFTVHIIQGIKYRKVSKSISNYRIRSKCQLTCASEIYLGHLHGCRMGAGFLRHTNAWHEASAKCWLRDQLGITFFARATL